MTNWRNTYFYFLNHYNFYWQNPEPSSPGSSSQLLPAPIHLLTPFPPAIPALAHHLPAARPAHRPLQPVPLPLPPSPLHALHAGRRLLAPAAGGLRAGPLRPGHGPGAGAGPFPWARLLPLLAHHPRAERVLQGVRQLFLIILHVKRVFLVFCPPSLVSHYMARVGKQIWTN